jgi:hypothetical protein
MFPLIKIIRLAGNLIQIYLLLFEIESFEVTQLQKIVSQKVTKVSE